ncbi:MAG: cyclohexa-1,5-dienecarbonyl-CoA hydratase [Bacteriovoracaceae bacterium]|jgi:cyclohexa-1,5-dienecarbonyl-CoA hydratase|nr:cyclohexa-1,5-dienecarbonyl-CoA hydratase [Bacteriovoracaceae bacterium]
MADQYIEVNSTHEGQVAQITLGPAPANIISQNLMGQLTSALKEIESQKDVKLVILCGSGKHFSFGASVEEHTKDRVGAMLPEFHKTIARLIDFPIPILSKVRGQCLGGGFEVAMASHFIFASKGAKFGVPEITLGVFPPVACALLSTLLTDTIAQELILTGKTVTAKALKCSGFVNSVSADEELDGVIEEFIVKEILPKSASSLRVATKASRLVLSERYHSSISKLEKLYLEELMSLSDANEGIESFLEKRSPKFSNS